MVVALKRGLTSKPEELTKITTKYNIGTFDRDGQVREVLKLNGFPSGSYESVESLMHAGLRVLADELTVEGAVLTDSLAKQNTQAPRSP